VRKGIDLIPASRRRYLEHAVKVLRNEFARELTRKKKTGPDGRPRRILKIILYGSMARGNPVRDYVNGYISDYDLLVIVSHEDLTDFGWWEGAGDAFLAESLDSPTRYPARFIVHDIHDVNEQIHLGRPFFKDIHRDGIILYEFSTKALAKPGNLTPEEIHGEARTHFEHWFERSCNFSRFADYGRSEEMLAETAFQFHQAVESAYHCALLTLTLYTPKLHDIERLRDMAEGIDQRLVQAWPRKHRYDRLPFTRLKRAYVDARYSRHYVITKEDLDFISTRVAALQALVKQICEERLHA